MVRRYVEIPARACRAVDKNYMILGMRWAWISDPDLVEGWKNFDVFSINCYAVDPTSAIQNIVDLGVDLPVMIGEFHFGALDAGLPATGLEGVLSQRDRGILIVITVKKLQLIQTALAAITSSAMTSLYWDALMEKTIILVCLTFVHSLTRI